MSRFSEAFRSAMWTIVDINTRERWILFAIFLNQFSYWPSFEFAAFGGFSFELAMVAGLIIFLNGYAEYGFGIVSRLFSMRRFMLLYVWYAYGLILGILLSDNPEVILVKGLYLGSVVVAGHVIAALHQDKIIQAENIFKGWVGIALLMVPLYLAQYLLASVGVDFVSKRAYRVGVFAFPRLHGFSFEPLFLAKWLLAPIIYSLTRPKLQTTVASILCIALFLTLGRGAILALVISLSVYAVAAKLSWKKVKRLFRPVVSGLVVAMLFAGMAAQLNGSTFLQGSFRYFDHLTLGVFNSGGAENVSTIELGDREVINTREIDRVGVVEASTISRLEAIEVGLEIWRENPVSGVGLFRVGEEANALYPQTYPDTSLVTNAQPVDILAETGIIGYVLILMFVAINWRHIFRKSILSIMLLALSLQFLFFTALFPLAFWIILFLTLTYEGKGLRFGQDSH